MLNTETGLKLVLWKTQTFLREKLTSSVHGDIKNERKSAGILNTLCITCKKLKENRVAHCECLALKVCIAVSNSICTPPTAVLRP